ncbi:Transcriptional regulator, TetR family [uncultured Pleomorphomonas sp.]|uniref:Transcriptional regulator, TetR family n=1 Tax=uncultured Pleomorphomonas sp. TaxID=442121 RepID=A0A212LFG7_9HYPH|nr:TetR/AcrR family transcriptional regulator [uncultured Pleomorphomonas sp.]SCM76295.1 Transcriptional regulator, TetR family [uncultured Pleomorphomonas sp.]
MDGDKKDVVRKRGRPKLVDDAARRQSILRAAHEAFVELGFSRTTTALVAARARVSKRDIYSLFATKTELFAAVVTEHRHLILDLPRPAGEDLPPLETLVRIFRLDIDEAAEFEREAILSLIVRESVQYPELSDYLYETEIIRSREELIDWLKAETLKGRMVIDDPMVCAGMLMDIVFGALLPRRRLRHRVDRRQRIEHIRKRLEIFLRGIR